jgi:hypothetical protein
MIRSTATWIRYEISYLNSQDFVYQQEKQRWGATISWNVLRTDRLLTNSREWGVCLGLGVQRFKVFTERSAGSTPADTLVLSGMRKTIALSTAEAKYYKT